MLGSLARKLRAVGVDTAYYRTGGDDGLLQLSYAEGRAILTSDRVLALRAKARHLQVILVQGRTDHGRLASILDSAPKTGITLAKGDPLCSLCGGQLARIARHEVMGRVPAEVWNHHRLFHRCVRCGQHYWRGGHWKKLRQFGRLLDKAGNVG